MLASRHSAVQFSSPVSRVIAAVFSRLPATASSLSSLVPVEAVRCALEVQEALATDAAQNPSDALQIRIGVNLGDIIVEEDGDVYGDGVNVAARLEQLADPGGVCISGAVYDQIEGKVERLFESRGEHHVKNIPRPVRTFATGESVASVGSARSPALPLPEKPSIAVLPFTNMSDDPQQDYFTDGMVEELIAALSRVRSLFVIARNSTFTYKNKAVDVRQISRDLGVRYVIEGSVRRSDRQVRVTAQLIDATDGSHIWADRFNGGLEEIFELQDALTSAIVGAIQPSIRSHEIERAQRKRPENMGAYDCVMRALPSVWSNTRENSAEIEHLLERAQSLDPAYALAKALASWHHAQRVIYLRSADPSVDKRRALELAEAAARLDSDDPLVLTALSAAYTLMRQLDLAAPPLERALYIDPNSAWAWQRSGWLQMYLGHPEAAIDHFERGLRLSPIDPLRFNSYVGIGAAHFNARDYDKAVEWIKRGLRDRPDATWAHRTLAAAYGNAGRFAEAREAVSVLLKAYPGLTISHLLEIIPATADHLSRYAEGLRIAGLPE